MAWLSGPQKLLWDAKNMKITNFDAANQFVREPSTERLEFVASNQRGINSPR